MSAIEIFVIAFTEFGLHQNKHQNLMVPGEEQIYNSDNGLQIELVDLREIGLVWFYGILTIFVYLMPNLVFT